MMKTETTEEAITRIAADMNRKWFTPKNDRPPSNDEGDE